MLHATLDLTSSEKCPNSPFSQLKLSIRPICWNSHVKIPITDETNGKFHGEAFQPAPENVLVLRSTYPWLRYHPSLHGEGTTTPAAGREGAVSAIFSFGRQSSCGAAVASQHFWVPFGVINSLPFRGPGVFWSHILRLSVVVSSRISCWVI